MKRFVAQNKILAVLVSLLLLQVLLVASDSSDLDDVAAMVTNAKKVPHMLFILDTSETMNSFAYSDYIEACDDAKHNADHAYDICAVALEQCKEVQSETGCVGGSIDCTSIANNCENLDSARTKIASYCAQVDNVFKFEGYPNEDRSRIDQSKIYTFVGPWTPDQYYSEDICFYDWTSDTNGDVVSGTNSGNWSNKQGVGGTYTITDENGLPVTVEYYNTDRRDWDCITDGNDNMSNGEKLSSYISDKGGVSGFWLNWKYATALDAVKILFADTHEFSYPPRSRGENVCKKYLYKPLGLENDTSACESGYENGTDSDGSVLCKDDPATGLPNYKKKKICFVSADTTTINPSTGVSERVKFDTAYLAETNDEQRKKILTAMQKIVAEKWTYDEPEILSDESQCTDFKTLQDFSIYDNLYTEALQDYEEGVDAHPDSVVAGGVGGFGCDKCMAFNGNTTNPLFLETNCKEFVTQDDHEIDREGDLGTYSIKYTQKCCKTSKCTNPKCKDNDLCCKNNAAAYPPPEPGEEASEGYKQCVEEGQTCELGFYSEFDQDMTHCCDSVDCVSGEGGAFEELDNHCFVCKDSAVIKKEEVLEVPPTAGTAVLSSSYGFTYTAGIELKVSISSDDTDFDAIEDMKVTLYSECDGVTPDAWSVLGSFSCYRESTDVTQQCSHYLPSATTNGVIMTPLLSGCETSGYKVKAVVSATGRYCDKDDTTFSVSLKYNLPEGSFSGSEQWRRILNPEENYYMVLRNAAGGGANSDSDVIYEYECKNAFYHTQVYTDTSSCKKTSEEIVQKLHEKGYPDVQYCDPDSRRQESYTKIDGCSFETRYVCTYLCRDEIKYEEPWKCMAFFYQMDEMDRGGLEECSEQCQKASGYDPETGKNNTEECCRCIDEKYYHSADWTREYHYFETVDGVTMPTSSAPNAPKKTYYCAVSGIMGEDTQAGWHAEIINGHIHEFGEGSYLLTPYMVGEDVWLTPYQTNNSWISDKTYLRRKKKDPDLKETSISVFKTATDAQSRENVCVYEVVDAWGGDLCDTCSTCTFGCVDDPSMHVADDKCAYPSFWMKVPKSDGGELVVPKNRLLADTDVNSFQTKIKRLKAVGGPTLGETLYDAWRYLGGMYAVYDPNHRYYNYQYAKREEDGHWVAPSSSTNTAYESPYENLDASCFLSEVVVFSGGQAQFDHNEKIEKIPGADKNCNNAEAPCVPLVGEKPYESSHKPYYETEWAQTSVQKVANFVKTHPFYHPDPSKKDSCVKTKELKHNLFGYDNDCKNDKYYQINKDDSADKTVVNRIHAGAIGEWTLSALYNGTDHSYLEEITKKIADDPASEDGKYCALTLGATTGCSSSNITDVFINMLKDPMKTDVVSGRPHWTSSLVQPYDVEEKYRGPEAYVAGAVPIEPSISKFWFGNLKKYMIDKGDNTCTRTISCENYPNCGDGCDGWHKQTFSSPADCFADDPGNDMAENLTEFKRLLAGGAAKVLEDKLAGSGCGTIPCYKSGLRNIYYDNGSEMHLLESISPGDLGILADKMGQNEDTANRILDYIYGYDSFVEANRQKLRFGYSEPCPDGNPDCHLIEVLNPMDIDFNHEASKKIKIRPLLLGAIVHSKPVAVSYGGEGTRIFAGANDGMLHAFDGGGNEKWAYIPSNAFKSIADMVMSSSDQMVFNPTVDGPITLLHIDKSHDGIINGSEKAYLIFGYRRGARGYTVINVTDPNNPEFVQNIQNSEMTDKRYGFSFGKAVVFRKCNNTNGCRYADELDYYLAVPGGYDTCADGYEPTCAMPDNSAVQGEPIYGNKFAIYKFDAGSGRFIDTPVFEYKRSNGESDVHKKWLVAPFASEPFAINTTGKGAVNTEFVYFTDLTGTVFRVNVSDNSPSEWSAKVVFASRESFNKDIWVNGKNYVGNNFFPPLEKYNPKNDPERIPIPVVTGNASLPKVNDENASMTVFYDKKPKTTDDDTKPYVYTSDYEESNLKNDNNFHDENGWKITFGGGSDKAGEKGITEPLVVYDVYGSKQSEESGKNGYALAWNTYVPKAVTECKSFGTSFNYERLLIDGSQGLEQVDDSGVGNWNPAACSGTSSQGISLATGVGVVATKDGYDLTFGAGAEIYRKKEISVLVSTTRIIKWYELY
ncbi:MAG: hypothetical protein J5647_08140 [Spirochaetaceae bacterium]|nr:hypothetical protein [Spirochaetaceae bacterium]